MRQNIQSGVAETRSNTELGTGKPERMNVEVCMKVIWRIGGEQAKSDLLCVADSSPKLVIVSAEAMTRSPTAASTGKQSRYSL